MPSSSTRSSISTRRLARIALAGARNATRRVVWLDWFWTKRKRGFFCPLAAAEARTRAPRGMPPKMRSTMARRRSGSSRAGDAQDGVLGRVVPRVVARAASPRSKLASGSEPR